MYSEVNNSLNYSFLSKNYKNILITGGLGFIGSCLIKRLLKETDLNIYNIDKEEFNNNNLSQEDNLNNLKNKKYTFFKSDIFNATELNNIFKHCNPDLIFHLAAESHVDRSIDYPRVFVNSNIIGTFNLLTESLKHYKKISKDRRNYFKLVHISTDEVFGSLGLNGSFNENSPYSPRSPYAASKAASDHLVSSWFHTYGLPTLISNCSNNFGPKQFPDKLIPSIIINAFKKQSIPIYGDGSNVRDWLFVEDHINALLTIAVKGEIGNSYCIGANNEKSNLEICHDICNLLDKIKPQEYSYNSLIKFVNDRPGHDFRYAIDSTKIQKELDWRPLFKYEESIKETVIWYLKNKVWVENIIKQSGYIGQRLGVLKNHE